MKNVRAPAASVGPSIPSVPPDKKDISPSPWNCLDSFNINKNKIIIFYLLTDDDDSVIKYSPIYQI